MTYDLKNIILLSVLLCLSAGISDSALADDLIELPRQLEIELALSALPTALRDEATIYVRDSEKGFVPYRQGSNGFATFVGRTSTRFYEADRPYTYPSDQLIPIAFDRTG